MDTSSEMKILMFLLAVGLAAAEKLDRTYLPPPGSKYAGGEPGDLQAPQEPKYQDTYTTTAPFATGQNNDRMVTIGDTRLVPGSARRPGPEIPGLSTDIAPITPTNQPFNYFQNTYKVPTTTTSYAFTQTTTFPPQEGFETTLNPIRPGFPIDESFNQNHDFVNQPFHQGQILNEQTGPIHPGLLQLGNQDSRHPGSVHTPISNISGLPNLSPGSQIDGRPVFNPNINQQGFPTSTVAPTNGYQQSEFVNSSPYDQGYTQHLGVQPPRQFIQQGNFPLSTFVPGYQTDHPSQYNYNVPNIQGSQFTGQQFPITPTANPQQVTTQYIDKFGNVQSTAVPGLTVPQPNNIKGSLPQPGLSQYSGDLNYIPGTSVTTFQNQVPYSQSIEPQGTLLPTVGSRGSITGSIPAQQQQSQHDTFSGQQNIYKIPEIQNSGQNKQYGGQQERYLPNKIIQENSNQENLKSQYPQSTISSTEIPQRSSQPESSIYSQYAGQKNIYPTGFSQEKSPQLVDQQSQIISQQGAYQPVIQDFDTSLINSNQQGGLPQRIGAQGSIPSTSFQQNTIPGQKLTYQQPAIEQPQFIDHQRLFPSTEIPNRFITPQQLGDQQQLTPSFPPTGHSSLAPSYSQSGFNYQDENINNVQGGVVPVSSDFLNQQQSTGPQPKTSSSDEQNLINSGIPSRQPFKHINEDQRVFTDGSQHIYSPGSAGQTTTFRPSFQQTPSPNTTPSSSQFYSTTPSAIYPSSTSLYPDVKSGTSGITLDGRPLPERPQAESDRNAFILNYENILSPEGYAYSFDTSNGIHADENGTAIDGVKANGSYSYIGDNGKLYSVVYTADENGFRPYGDHLPTPPPIPAAIQKVVEQATKDKAAGISHDGFYDESKYGHKKYQGSKHRRPGYQNKIINGADIPDGAESSYDAMGSMKKLRTEGERKPVTFGDDKQDTSEYDGTRYDIDNVDKFEDNIDKKIKTQSTRINPSQRPSKTPTNVVYDDEPKRYFTDSNKNQQKFTGQRNYQRNKPTTGEDMPNRQPISPSRNRKPMLTKDQYGSVQTFDDKETNVDSGFSNEQEVIQNKKVPSKSTESKYLVNDEKSQQTDIPGQLNAEELVRKFQNGNRPGTFVTDVDDSYYDFKTSVKGTRPQKPSKFTGDGSSNDFGMQHYDTDGGLDGLEDYQEHNLPDQKEYSLAGRPIGTIKQGSSATTYGQTNKQPTESDHHESSFDNTNYPKGSRYEQNNRLSYDERTDIPFTKYPEQSQDEGSGYFYTPPQNKFNQGQVNTFPSRFSEKVTTRKPSTKYNINNNKTIVKPFITPNVHHGKDESYEEVSEENMTPRKPEKTAVTPTTLDYEYDTTDSSEYFEKQYYPEQDIGEEKTSSKIHSSEKTGPIRNPGYQIDQSTNKPQYYDQFVSKNEESAPQEGSKRPIQNYSARYPSNSSKQISQGKQSQNKLEKTVGTSKNPGNTDIYSTTPTTFRKRPSQQIGGHQYPITSQPSDTSSTKDEYTEDTTLPGDSTTKSGFKRPLTRLGAISYTTAPSIADRPGSTNIPFDRTSYENNDKITISGRPMIKPGFSESSFGKPSIRPGTLQPSYSKVPTKPGTTRTDTVSALRSRPGSFEGENYNKQYPDFVTYTPESGTSGRSRYPTGARPGTSQNIGQQDLPSTTYRPDYSIKDVIPAGSYNDGTSAKPLQLMQGSRRPGTNKRPVSTTRPSYSPRQEIYQPSTINQGLVKPGNTGSKVTFRPSEPRFGSPTQEAAGLKPAEFGPSSVTTPGYLEPYGPTTGKTVGEDFSGPKQMQKFDPKTGYYY